jgi:hypothetical protein
LQDELVHAAQQELHEQRRQRAQQHKLRKANKQEAVQAAQQLIEAPAAFAQFTARLLRFYRTYGIEWPTVTVTYRDLNVHTKVCTGCLSWLASHTMDVQQQQRLCTAAMVCAVL